MNLNYFVNPTVNPTENPAIFRYWNYFP